MPIPDLAHAELVHIPCPDCARGGQYVLTKPDRVEWICPTCGLQTCLDPTPEPRDPA
jgi:hypothetical protein